MINLQFDMREFERRARSIAAAEDQIPFALSRTLNDAAEIARSNLIDETWPRHVQVRDRNFLRAALTTSGRRATKRNLTVEIYDKLGRAHLGLHSKGGIKQAKGRLAIPDQKVKARRGSKGVPKSLRPSALPNSFRKGDAIFQRMGGKKNPHLRLMYVLKPTANQKADVPFDIDFRSIMLREVRSRFGVRMREAMRTRR